MVRGLHAPGRHSGKVHALDVLVLEIPIAKLDLRIEIEDLLSLAWIIRYPSVYLEGVVSDLQP